MKKIITLIVLSLLSNFGYAKTPALNYEKYGHLPMVTKAKVSPDGSLIAAVFNSEAGPSIVISKFGSNELSTIVKLKKSQDRIDTIYWANSDRLVISASYSTIGFGDRYRISRLFSVNKDGSDLVEIKRNLKKDAPNWLKRMSPKLISSLPNDSENILVQLYNREDNAASVFKVNIYKNDFVKVFSNKYDVHAWSVNKEGDVVFGYGIDEDDATRETQTFWFRDGVSEDWKLLHKKKYFEKETFNPVLVVEDKVYVLSDHKTGRNALWLYDIKAGAFEELIYGHEKYDINSVIFNFSRTKVVGVRYADNYLQTHFFEKAESKVDRIVSNSFKNYKTSIASWSIDRKKVLVMAQEHNTPSKYFWLDLQKKSGGFWFSQYPYLEGQALGNKTAFEFEASDGMMLNGYITMPSKTSKSKPKLIIHPHGGPFGPRDYQYFDPYVQYLTNLGYAVLQVNFRGSGGFGSHYQSKGYRQWGKRMQQDIYDSIDWLAEQKTVDTENSCVFGGSYGGYVALTAAFQKPNQFKCIVSIAGIADLYSLSKEDSRWKGGLRAHVRETIGDINDDETIKELKNNSAEYHLDKIKAPILLIHGVNDTRVNVSQSRSFYDKAKNAGIDIQYEELKYGTHFLDENDNRLAAFKALGDFLTKHL